MELDALGMIDVEHGNRRSAGPRESQQQNARPAEMAVPILSAGVIQSSEFARVGFNAGQIWPFAQIASSAAMAQVIRRIVATMLLRKDVLDMKTHKRRRLLRQAAVFTAIPRSPTDEPAQQSAYHVLADRERRERALA